MTMPEMKTILSHNHIDVDTLESIETEDLTSEEHHVVLNDSDIEKDVLVPSKASSDCDYQALNKVVAGNRKARLHWEDVRLLVKKGKDEKTILDGVWGESPQGEISAIMGPSGSG
jgi:hypothetical protein